MNSYGFIITRHVNSETTNKYWNCCVQCIRRHYPLHKIIIIDDNSQQHFLKAEREYENVEITQSEHPGRGEFLPFYYLLKCKYFGNAVILHDSVFFHKRIKFENLIGKAKVVPLWHFEGDKENSGNSLKVASPMRNRSQVEAHLHFLDMPLGFISTGKWTGCFGCQCFINLKFLEYLENKYAITKMVSSVKNRTDRCSLERIMGILFFLEGNGKAIQLTSILGNIFHHQSFEKYRYENYVEDIKRHQLPRGIIKIWTGR
jgi:hypothetical protein